MPKTVLFFRRFRGPTGGHLKIADYVEHVRSSPAYKVQVYVMPDSWPDHPWKDDPALVTEFDPDLADILVLGGVDWNDMPAGIEDRIPVVNLVQHLKHADPADERYAFLTRKAHRICVGPEVAEAVTASGRANGPILCVPNGIDVEDFRKKGRRNVEVFIAGLKQKQLATEVAEALAAAGITVDCLTAKVPRETFLTRMASARIAVTLPDATEGFFLPALEAMALGCAVVCPDSGGNRSFCIDGETCLMPAAEAPAIIAAVKRLMNDQRLRQALREAGPVMAERHSLARERRAVLSILNGISPRNILLTGLPRSGTTLTCSLLNEVANVVALHEPMSPADLAGKDAAGFIRRVVTFIDEQRDMILEEGFATSKSQGGQVPRNPLGDTRVGGHRHRVLDGHEIEVTNVTRDDFDLCIKHPGMFSARLPELSQVFDCYATVRNPLSVLLSWRDSGMSVAVGRMPAAESVDPGLARRLDAIADPLARQIALIDYLFARYRDHLPDRTLRYEDVVATRGAELGRIVPAAAALSVDLQSRNALNLSRDPEARRIAEALLADKRNACWHFYKPEDVAALLAEDQVAS